MEARITAHSQPYRLRERMEEAEVRHGTDVRVDLPGVRVMAFADSWFSAITGAFFNAPTSSREGEVFFCNMGRIKVNATLVEGDDALPRALELAQQIAAYPQSSLRADRAAVLAAWGRPLADGLRGEAEGGLPTIGHPEMQDGLARFLSRDRPA